VLSEKIDAMKDELVAAIQEAVRIKSVGGEPSEGAPYGEGPRKCLDWTLAFAEQMGFRTKNVDNVAGWAEMGEGDEMVALLGRWTPGAVSLKTAWSGAGVSWTTRGLS
jgi:succinyl-diaminopimelate desuccinylase